MEEICKNAPSQLCISLQLVSCCDYYQSENHGVDGVDGGSWEYYGYLRSNKMFQRHTNASIENVINSENLIQLLHDLSIQIRHLHISGFTFTDIDGDDILEVEGHYGIINVNKLIKFNKSTGYASLNYPISFGKFMAPELSNIKQLPAIDVIHKNSVIWSVGRMVVGVLFDEPDGEEKYKWLLSLSKNYNGNDNDNVNDNVNDNINHGVVPILIRCLNIDPSERMLLVF